MPADAELQQAMQKFLNDGEFRQKVITSGKDGGTDAVAQLLRGEGAELSQDHLDVIDSIDWNRSETELHTQAKGIHQDAW